jgi:UDP-N-acetylglucosamine--dolichyl-phosphate N-acetylglucosaminephosphotransferase
MKMWMCKLYIFLYNLMSDVSSSLLILYQTHFSIKHSPEALGIVPGAIFLICLMFCLVGFATNHPQKVRTTSLLFLSTLYAHDTTQHLIHYFTLSFACT